MKNIEECIGMLIKGLVSEELNSEQAVALVNNSLLDDLDKKALIRILNNEEYCVKRSDVIIKLIDFNKSNHKKVALFEKVSKKQYLEDMVNIGLGNLDYSYDVISLPVRSTKGSAGYDFISPVDIELKPGESKMICTGIRCCMKENWVLKLYPRSSSGTKFRLQLNNTVGVIDSDYYYANNEGHIMAKITNDSNEGKTFTLNKGDKLCQGVFVEYGITFDDDVFTERTGGFGSTGK